MPFVVGRSSVVAAPYEPPVAPGDDSNAMTGTPNAVATRAARGWPLLKSTLEDGAPTLCNELLPPSTAVAPTPGAVICVAARLAPDCVCWVTAHANLLNALTSFALSVR